MPPQPVGAALLTPRSPTAAPAGTHVPQGLALGAGTLQAQKRPAPGSETSLLPLGSQGLWAWKEHPGGTAEQRETEHQAGSLSWRAGSPLNNPKGTKEESGNKDRDAPPGHRRRGASIKRPAEKRHKISERPPPLHLGRASRASKAHVAGLLPLQVRPGAPQTVSQEGTGHIRAERRAGAPHVSRTST